MEYTRMKKQGKSKSEALPYGQRRVNAKGEVLAPRHFRKLHKRLLSEVTDSELAAVYFEEEDLEGLRKRNAMRQGSYKGNISKAEKLLLDPGLPPDKIQELKEKISRLQKEHDAIPARYNEILAACSAFRAAKG